MVDPVSTLSLDEADGIVESASPRNLELDSFTQLPEWTAPPQYMGEQSGRGSMRPSFGLSIKPMGIDRPGSPTKVAAYKYFEPSEEAAKRYAKRMLDKESAAFVIADIDSEGTSSKSYEMIADDRWKRSRRAFEEEGHPVFRVEFTGPSAGSTIGEKAALSVARASSVISPMLLGLDRSLAFGQGREIGASAEDLFANPAQTRALEALVKRGILEPTAEQLKDIGEASPVSQAIGSVAGMLSPQGVGARIGSAATKGLGRAAASVTGKAPGVAGKIVGGGLSGSAGGVVGEGAELAVETAGSLLRGEEEFIPSAEEVKSRLAGAGTIGFGLGAGTRAIGMAGRGLADDIRLGGRDIKDVEAVSGFTNILKGVDPGPRIRKIEQESLAKRNVPGTEVDVVTDPVNLLGHKIKGRMISRSEEIYDKALDSIRKDKDEFISGNKNKRIRLKSTIDKYLNELSKDKTPWRDDSQAMKAFHDTVEVKAFVRNEPAMKRYILESGGRKLGNRTISSLGLIKKASKAIEKLNRQRFMDKQSRLTSARIPMVPNPKPVKDPVIVVASREMTPQQFMEATSALDSRLNFKLEFTSKDPIARKISATVREDAKDLGPQFVEMRNKHSELLSRIKPGKKALLGTLDALEAGDVTAENKAAGKALKSGSSSNFEADELTKFFKDDPDIIADLELARGVKAMSRIREESQSGDVRILNVLRNRFDPIARSAAGFNEGKGSFGVGLEAPSVMAPDIAKSIGDIYQMVFNEDLDRRKRKERNQ